MAIWISGWDGEDIAGSQGAVEAGHRGPCPRRRDVRREGSLAWDDPYFDLHVRLILSVSIPACRPIVSSCPRSEMPGQLGQPVPEPAGPRRAARDALCSREFGSYVWCPPIILSELRRNTVRRRRPDPEPPPGAGFRLRYSSARQLRGENCWTWNTGGPTSSARPSFRAWSGSMISGSSGLGCRDARVPGPAVFPANCLAEEYRSLKPYSQEEVRGLAAAAEPYFGEVRIV